MQSETDRRFSEPVLLLRRYVVVAVMAIAAIWLNPFDFSRWTSLAKEDFFFRVAAFSYPADKSPIIELVIADDSTIAPQPGSGGAPRWTRWPLPLQAWGNAVAEAADRGAKAIFLDVVIVDQREPAEVAALVEAITYASQTADVFLAAGGPAFGTPTGVLPDLSAPLKGNPRVHFVSAARSDSQGLSDTYRLDPTEQMPAAAVALAQSLCRHDRRWNCEEIRRSATGDMRVWWKAPPSASNCARIDVSEATAAGCTGLAQTSFARTVQLLWRGATQGLCDNVFKGAAPCRLQPPYSLSNLPHALWSLQSYVAGDADPASAPDAVVIGADFAFARDRARSAVYGAVPGAAIHAMAVDNLLSTSGRVFRERSQQGIPDIWYLTMWVVLLCLVSFCVRVLFWKLARSTHSGWVHYSLLTAILCAAIAVDWASRVAPADWFALLGVVALSSLATAGGKRKWQDRHG